MDKKYPRVIRVSEKTHKQVRMIAAEKGITMAKATEALLTKATAQENKPIGVENE